MLDGIGRMTGVSRGALCTARRAAAAAGYAEALAGVVGSTARRRRGLRQPGHPGGPLVSEFAELCEATSSADLDNENELAIPADERASKVQLAKLISRVLDELPEQEARSSEATTSKGGR